MHKRLGKFFVSKLFYEKEINHLQEIMKECIPIKVRYDPIANVFEYIALSKHFDEIELEENPPVYMVEVNKNKNNDISWEFKKVAPGSLE